MMKTGNHGVRAHHQAAAAMWGRGGSARRIVPIDEIVGVALAFGPTPTLPAMP